jgi:site-specific recombinase XerD
MNPSLTINDAAERFLLTVSQARSENTTLTYGNAIAHFLSVLEENHLPPSEKPSESLTEEAVAWMISSLKEHAPSTERLYLTAVTRFYEFLASENLATVNLPRVQMLIHQRARRPGQRLPMFPRDNIDTIVEHMLSIDYTHADSPEEKLRYLRDRAFLITLADTGLRVHEACGLRRGDIDWNEGKALVIGKGNRQAVVRFSNRSMQAIRDYLGARATLDGSSGKPLASLPIYARHDKGAGSKVKPITTTTGREIVAEWVKSILGPESVGTITPHSFRHYFVTRVLHSSGNLKLAQELARHKSIAVTQRYAHLNDDELDRGYYDIFDSSRKKSPE